jgi:hypothetical protein
MNEGRIGIKIYPKMLTAGYDARENYLKILFDIHKILSQNSGCRLIWKARDIQSNSRPDKEPRSPAPGFLIFQRGIFIMRSWGMYDREP